MYLRNKNILVTGAAGTIGRELIKTIAEHQPKRLIGIDNNETEVFEVGNLFSKQLENLTNFESVFCDIRNLDTLSRIFEGVDYVFHCAALKHVGVGERVPNETIATNINGTSNVIEAAKRNQVSTVVFTSSDKAVNPTNVMGSTKLLGEKMMTAANSSFGGKHTKFISTRFGNVLGSRGSVVPIFFEQIKSGQNITITHELMTRFIMTVKQACALVVDAGKIGHGGEVFVTKMPVVNILALAEAMLSIMQGFGKGFGEGCDVEFIGAREGEKLFEELMTEEETRRAIELQKMFVVLPAFSAGHGSYPGIVSTEVLDPYISKLQPAMTHEQISNFFHREKVLDTFVRWNQENLMKCV